MDIFITAENVMRLKSMFSNLSSYYVIDVDEIMTEIKLDINQEYAKYLISSEIERLLDIGLRSKRLLGIIYVNGNMNCDLIVSLKKSIAKLSDDGSETFIIIDDYDVPKQKDYYELFDEVRFFPSKVKLKPSILKSKQIVYAAEKHD